MGDREILDAVYGHRPVPAPFRGMGEGGESTQGSEEKEAEAAAKE